MKINDAFSCLMESTERLNIVYGGAGSGKSYYLAQMIILKLIETERNFLVIRKVGNTLRDSVWSLFLSVITDNDLSPIFHVNKSEFTITNTVTGNQIICKGLDDPEKIKSITVKRGQLTDIWMEEATELTPDDFKQLNLRLRGKNEYKKQIWMSFNPISNLHWIKKEFFDNPTDDQIILKTTYKDNAFLDDEYKAELESLKDRDKVYYDIYVLGEWGVLGNLVFNNWEVKDLSEIEDSFNSYYTGLDFGFTNDPTAIVRLARKDWNIYILREHYEKGLSNSDIAKVYKDKFDGYVYCDNAEPKSIRELKTYNISAKATVKGKDSVKHGIQWIRQHKIIIDKRCTNFINEISTYKYREDKDGNVMNEPLDMNNHLMDAMRYALEHLMRIYRKTGLRAGQLGL